jgi:hypothetical protein
MDGLRLQIGDRVALLEEYIALPAGAQGVVIHVYASDPNLYRVRFDTDARELPIYAHYLNRLTDTIGGIALNWA